MGLRFHKSLRVAPGLRINLSKKGVSSLSLSGKGLSYNIGRKNARTTVGLPGSGLSYSKNMSYTQGQAGGTPKLLIIICIALIVGAVYFLRS